MSTRKATPSGGQWTPDSIRKLRLHLHMSQELFAEAVEVSRQTVSQWEKGKKTPSGLSVARLDQLVAESVRVPSSESDLSRQSRAALAVLTGGTSLVRETAAPYLTSSRRSLQYWLGRLEEAGGVLEDATTRHRRIREELAAHLDTGAEPE